MKPKEEPGTSKAGKLVIEDIPAVPVDPRRIITITSHVMQRHIGKGDMV